MKVTLNETWGWKGTSYGPGECEVPDEMAGAMGLAPALPAAGKSEEEPDVHKPSSKSRKSTGTDGSN